MSVFGSLRIQSESINLLKFRMLNDYKQQKMSTTEILSGIQLDLKKDNSLHKYLPKLVSSLNSHKPFVTTNMNAKQQLTQLQSLLQNELNLIQKSLKSQHIDLQAQQLPQDEEIQPEQSRQMDIEQQDNQADQNFEGQVDRLQVDSIGLEQQVQQEFEQPDYSRGKKQKRPLKHKKGHIKDENAQDQGEQLQYQDQQEGQQSDEQALQGEDQEALEGQEDVGLYGQELNSKDQDLENYQNEFDQQEYNQFQKEFGQPQNNNSKKSKFKKPHSDQQDDPDEFLQDNFDHFRQIQLDNQKAQTLPRTQLDNQIQRLQQKIIGHKSWTMKGQVKAKQRPANSLLEYDLQFSSGIKYSHEITQQRNTELEELIKKRILTDMFDDRTRFVNSSHIRQHFGSLKQVSREKNKMSLGEVYESQFKNFLGIGQNKNDKLKTEIIDSFKQLNYFLDSLSNFSFVPKPTKQTTRKGQSEAIIVQEKVPLTLWNGQKQVQKDKKHRFESQKQVDNQAKRLKNKRIGRQRKKQQIKKKLNKKIEYGGTTKFLAQAKQKAMMNNKPLKVDGVNMKYNKSASFFKNINQNKGGKPNPDISKMKI